MHIHNEVHLRISRVRELVALAVSRKHMDGDKDTLNKTGCESIPVVAGCFVGIAAETRLKYSE